MSIYSKERAKITIGTILMSLAIIVGLWLMVFVSDYMMYKNEKPIIFGTIKIQDVGGTRVTIENGLGYYVITNGLDAPQMYLFGYKIK